MPDDALNSDPLVGFSFQFTAGAISGYFTEVSGLGSETEVIEHKVMAKGVKEPIIRKIPGRLKWGDVTLKRGITSNMDFYTWRKQVEEGKVDKARLSATVTMYDQMHAPKAEWTIASAWPSKISGPSIAADANAIGIEELTIVHEGIKRVM